MRDAGQRQTALMCSGAWACPTSDNPPDCRSVLREAGGPVLEIVFVGFAVNHHWTDYDAIYGSRMRYPAFHKQERTILACPIPPIPAAPMN